MADLGANIIDPISIATGLGAGLLLGGLFFAGLWWTVHRALQRANVALWFAASYLIRVALLAGGLYFLAHDNPARGIAACIGVILARIAVSRFGASASADGAARGQLR